MQMEHTMVETELMENLMDLEMYTNTGLESPNPSNMKKSLKRKIELLL